MFETVQGKTLRGILSGVRYNQAAGTCTGVLESPDFCEGEPGRNELVQGRSIYTSTVECITVVEGQLVIVTRYSAYVIEGTIALGPSSPASRSEEYDDD